MQFSKIKEDLLLNVKNIPGPRVKRKILVFECDDWGSVRMPSMEVFEQLTAKGFSFNSRFDKFDTLADEEDLSELFSALETVKDKNGHPAIFTPFVNVTNPDFEKVKKSGFQEFFFEPFTKTLNKYKRSPKTINLWKEGFKSGIFVPEYHGNSHISMPLWLEKLRQGNMKLLEAFDHGVVSINIDDVNPVAKSFRPELFFENSSQIPSLVNSLMEGTNHFKEIFGFSPSVFTPTNGVFHPVFEKYLSETGLKYIYVSWFTTIPDGQGGLKNKFYPVGLKGKNGLTYYSRNCAFEPTDNGYAGIEKTMRQISVAFRWGKPAIISTHRVNFVGAISKPNRKKGLTELKKLLATVKNKWPNVEFMSSANMLKILFQ